MGEKTRDEILSEAMQAHTDLNMFHLIQTILDDHCRATTTSDRAQKRIGEICRSECQRLLIPIDKAKALLT